jgi:hypothetical protein
VLQSTISEGLMAEVNTEAPFKELMRRSAQFLVQTSTDPMFGPHRVAQEVSRSDNARIREVISSNLE